MEDDEQHKAATMEQLATLYGIRDPVHVRIMADAYDRCALMAGGMIRKAPASSAARGVLCAVLPALLDVANASAAATRGPDGGLSPIPREGFPPGAGAADGKGRGVPVKDQSWHEIGAPADNPRSFVNGNDLARVFAAMGYEAAAMPGFYEMMTTSGMGDTVSPIMIDGHPLDGGRKFERVK